MSFRHLKNQAGFAFIELILTTFVLSVGLLGGFILMDNAVSNSLGTDHVIMASQMANEKLEAVIADKAFQGYDSVDDADYPDESDFDVPYGSFTRSVAVFEVDASDLSTPDGGSGFKRVNVTVNWGEEDYENITVTTILSNY